MFLCAQVTWHSVERLICAMKEDRRSSLKVRGMCHIFVHRQIVLKTI